MDKPLWQTATEWWKLEETPQARRPFHLDVFFFTQKSKWATYEYKYTTQNIAREDSSEEESEEEEGGGGTEHLCGWGSTWGRQLAVAIHGAWMDQQKLLNPHIIISCLLSSSSSPSSWWAMEWLIHYISVSVSVCLCFCQTGILLNPPSLLLLLLLLLLHVISLVPRRDSAEERPRQTLHMAPHQKQAPPPSIARESTSAARDLLDTNWNILEDSSAVSSSSSSSSVSMLQPGISDTPGVVKGMD